MQRIVKFPDVGLQIVEDQLFVFIHSQNININNNMIDFVGHMGILLCGYGPGTKDVNKNNKIINNVIHHVGRV